MEFHYPFRTEWNTILLREWLWLYYSSGVEFSMFNVIGIVYKMSPIADVLMYWCLGDAAVILKV